MGLNLLVPDFSTLSRPVEDVEIPDLSNILETGEIVNVIIDSTDLKVFGSGEWHECRYNLKKRRDWRKLSLIEKLKK